MRHYFRNALKVNISACITNANQSAMLIYSLTHYKEHSRYDNIETINIENIEDSAISLEDAEKEMIKKSLERNNGKRKKCAEELKISERTLYRKIKEYNLE